MKHKQLVREKFKEEVFKRDNYKCKVCKTNSAKDTHHISDRSLMPNGGYVLENGISLCHGCHWCAERFHLSDGKKWLHDYHPDDLYKLINSSYELAVEKSEKLK